jgi:hypothetical protein
LARSETGFTAAENPGAGMIAGGVRFLTIGMEDALDHLNRIEAGADLVVMTTYFRLALDVSLKQEKIAILGIGPEEGLGYDARFRPAGCEPLPRSQVPQREPTKCRRND